ncbi:MAG: ABC transporter substrate-binding protein [Nitrospirae bacterium]|nr:ABC transporter substrate-binding protein [Nitrospirota bacterium]
MRITKIISFFGVITIAFISLSAVASTEPSQKPQQVVMGVVDKVLAIIKDPTLKGPEKQQQRRSMIRTAVEDRFDFHEMSQRSLAVHWQRRSDAEKKEFAELFKDLLENAYINKIEKYTDEKIDVVEEKTEGGFSTVKTEIITKKGKIPIDYRLKELGDGKEWKVYDVVIEGVSLVNNYRTQFQSIINTKGYDALTKMLREKKTP